MADLFCSFLDFRSLSTNYYKLHLSCPCNKNFPSSFVHSHNTRFTRRNPLHLTLSSSPNLDVISTHEHSDGSLLFRFGDPSQVVENVELEKPDIVQEEKKREGERECSDVKVLDGDDERQVMVNTVGREVEGSGLSDESDEPNSNCVKNICIEENEKESGEKLLEGSKEIELPVSISSVETEVSSTPHCDSQTIGYEQEVANEEQEDSSLASISLVDEISETENSIATEELAEKNIVDATTLDPVYLNPDNNVSQSTPETVVTKDVSVDSEHRNMGDEVENEISPGDKESDLSELLSDSLQLQPSSCSEQAECENLQVTLQNVVAGSGSEGDANDILTESPQFESATNLSVGAEIHTSVDGTGMSNDIVTKESESDTIQLMPVSRQLETESKLDGETGDDTVEKTEEDQLIVTDESESDTIQLMLVSPQLETKSKLDDIVEKSQEDQLIVKDEIESGTIQLMPESPHLEMEYKLDEETGIDTQEEFREDDEVENPTTLIDGPQDLITVTERTEDSDNYVQISELLEASGNEATELESTESATNSEETVKSDFVLSSGAALLPHPSKVLTGGEDAYFVTGQNWIGVADGVGQWSLEGTNPGVYAQDLIRNFEKRVSDYHVSSINYPLDLLNLSVAETHSLGSSTVLIARFDGQTLHVANIGDSGFIILRHGTVYKRSSPMLHLFHFPIQLERGNDPSHLAEFYQVDLEEEDVIITATDGLLDNLYDEEISSVVLKSLASDMKLEEIAESLAKRAQEVGKSAFSRSPFADNAQAAGYVGYTGGKLDDVTVIVSIVERKSNL